MLGGGWEGGHGALQAESRSVLLVQAGSKAMLGVVAGRAVGGRGVTALSKHSLPMCS